MTSQEELKKFYNAHIKEIGESFEDFCADVEALKSLDTYKHNLEKRVKLTERMNRQKI